MASMIPCQVYLLATGGAARAGGPDAWRTSEGRTLLERHVDFLSAQFDRFSVTVSILPEWDDRCRRLQPGFRWLHVDPDLSQTGSFLALLKAYPMSAWSFVYGVEMPVWEPELFQTLAGRVEHAREAEAIMPTHRGRRGYPILLSPTVQKPILGLNPAKDRIERWLQHRKLELVEVPFSCPSEGAP